MICLRCSECCIGPAVIIVVDPALGPVEDNLAGKNSGQRCRHLLGEEPPYTCAVHHYKWFPESPCGRHKQMERHADELCRAGNYHLNGVTLPGERAPCSG
jgi:hypothetical protein